MVSTRNHPDTFPSATSSPSKTLTKSAPSSSQIGWSHTPSNLTLLWLAISLPLVTWDIGYVLLRPYSMPGGSLHSPIWTPYALYGSVDYIYGWKAYNEHNGFTAAQTFLNVVETVMYGYYLWIVYVYGKASSTKGRGAPKPSLVGWIGEARSVGAQMGALAALIGFSAALMTLAKTILYGLNEYFSGFANVGHNDFVRLTFLWIIPNGAWIALPTYMTYVFGQEILQGLAIAARSQATAATTALDKAD